MKNRNIVNKLPHKDSWRTPQYLIKELEQEFGEMFDPCPLNHDINKWDGLKIDWKPVNFINPPYSLKLKEAFVKKAIKESKRGCVCVCLLPVSTSTKLFHKYILPNKKEIRFIKGRIKFEGINSEGQLVSNKCGMHDSMIVIFDKRK